jgi:hypothetical protein
VPVIKNVQVSNGHLTIQASPSDVQDHPDCTFNQIEELYRPD